jgi:hypothetical protein
MHLSPENLSNGLDELLKFILDDKTQAQHGLRSI